jgi:hypothetical protein
MDRGRPRSVDHLWTDHCAVLDIFTLPRPRPQPDPNGPLAKYIDDFGAARSVSVTAKWADGRETEATIRLVTTTPNFGGRRYWYLCSCGRRVAKLYALISDRRFLCRKCRGAKYFSSYRKTHIDRLCHLIGRQNRLSEGQQRRQWSRLLRFSPDALR